MVKKNTCHPRLKIESYFDGKIIGWGYFQNRFGTVKNRFKAILSGSLMNDTLTINEQFTDAKGDDTRRLWSIKIKESNQYEGFSQDIIGSAKGYQSGNHFHWQYSILLPVNGKQWKVNFDDHLYLQEDGILINTATIRKWGITIGTMTFVFIQPHKTLKAIHL
ncbi:hypothetical protein CI610_02623 [invertebrate metagenome]|uniref:Lipoprotein n=1 Tax=invertebrate metagenome TaxID=1711999 RepID=A0A2H9T5G2_9ZZZZ